MVSTSNLFDVCDLITNIKQSTLKDLLTINKVIARAKIIQNVYRLNLINFSAALMILLNGGSQGGYMILLGELGKFSDLVELQEHKIYCSQ